MAGPGRAVPRCAARRAARLSAAWRGAAGLEAAALLRSSFTARAGSVRFYLLTASLAGAWTGGALGGAHPVARRRLAYPPRKPLSSFPSSPGPPPSPCSTAPRGRSPPPHPAPCHRQRAPLRRRQFCHRSAQASVLPATRRYKRVYAGLLWRWFTPWCPMVVARCGDDWLEVWSGGWMRTGLGPAAGEVGLAGQGGPAEDGGEFCRLGSLAFPFGLDGREY
jgi:hypothetical protein